MCDDLMGYLPGRPALAHPGNTFMAGVGSAAAAGLPPLVLIVVGASGDTYRWC